MIRELKHPDRFLNVFLIDVIIIRVWEEQDSFSIDVLQ